MTQNTSRLVIAALLAGAISLTGTMAAELSAHSPTNRGVPRSTPALLRASAPTVGHESEAT
jgi:hypothetical protein